MSATSIKSITIITSPYHVGLRASPVHRSRVSEGPDFLLSSGLLASLQGLGLPIRQVELAPVADDFEGEIGRTFELLRRTARAVTEARNSGSFPIILAGNCCTTVGVAAGVWGSNDMRNKTDDALGCVWFDAHDDYNVPDTVISGYFDSQGIAMMAGECWKTLMHTVPGHRAFDLRNLVHCGMRDVNDLERSRVEGSPMGVVWGNAVKRVDFAAGLKSEMDARFAPGQAALIHLDLDVLDPTVGKANSFASPGGLSDNDLTSCMETIVGYTVPVALTLASFDPFCDTRDGAQRVTNAAKSAVHAVLQGLKDRNLL
ncbi:hypothetical protein QBC47DRAFT_418606 [Echria macrotheca]|uniref:Arginase n=1 Tax=Echria macrotheca TaxID=438768 RepID=A0AAJ0B1D7_9PEZI|nr:hypothetical protein QBC47DRAFT_418606 [Echria macrotheca]